MGNMVSAPWATWITVLCLQLDMIAVAGQATLSPFAHGFQPLKWDYIFPPISTTSERRSWSMSSFSNFAPPTKATEVTKLSNIVYYIGNMWHVLMPCSQTVQKCWFKVQDLSLFHCPSLLPSRETRPLWNAAHSYSDVSQTDDRLLVSASQRVIYGHSGMTSNWPELLVMGVFYLMVLATGIWASRKAKQEEKKCPARSSEVTMVGGRNLNIWVSIFTMTGRKKWW